MKSEYLSRNYSTRGWESAEILRKDMIEFCFRRPISFQYRLTFLSRELWEVLYSVQERLSKVERLRQQEDSQYHPQKVWRLSQKVRILQLSLGVLPAIQPAHTNGGYSFRFPICLSITRLSRLLTVA